MLKKVAWDGRRTLALPGGREETIAFAAHHFVEIGKKAIEEKGAFYVALSGGSTPKAIYESLSKTDLDWTKVHLFWSDERNVPPTSPESNYHMAMEAGLQNMPIPKSHIHRMVAEREIEKNAKHYEEIINTLLKGRPFDLIMLGMGEDGHTASLFPETAALQENKRLVVSNFVPQKGTFRITMTYPCINQALHIAIYVLGEGKREMVGTIFNKERRERLYPIEEIGTDERPALWILDEAAAKELKSV